MKKVLFFAFVLKCASVFSQNVFHFPATFKDSNYLGLGIAESMSKVVSDSDYIYSLNDSGSTIYTYYYNVSFNPGRTSSGQINLLFEKKKYGYAVTVDCNNNKNFKDDSTITLFSNSKENRYSFTICPPKNNLQKHLLYLNLQLFTIERTERNGYTHKEVSLKLVHKNSIFTSFSLGNNLYKVEAIPKYLNNGTGEARIGFSEPNKNILKMDLDENVIPHHLRNDTIISGTCKFIIDSVDFFNNTISLTEWPMTANDYGYKVSSKIRNYSLSFLKDVNKNILLQKLFKNCNYLLIDFWGSWCQPCLKNITKLVELNKKSENLNLNIIGIDCERTDNPIPAINILKKLGVKYENFFISLNLNPKNQVLNDLDIYVYPTYILLNRDLKIVMRETNEEGLKKIENFFKK